MPGPKKIAATFIYVAVVAITAVLFLAFREFSDWNGQTVLAFGALLLAETALWLYVSGMLRKSGAGHSVPVNLGLLTVLAGYAAVSVILAILAFLPFLAYAVIHAIALLLAGTLFGFLYLASGKIKEGFIQDAQRTANWSGIITSAKVAQTKLDYWEPQKKALLKKELDELVDIIQYSDPATLPGLAETEYSLQLDLQLLSQMLDAHRDQPPHSQALKELQHKIVEAQNGVKLRNLQLAAGKS